MEEDGGPRQDLDGDRYLEQLGETDEHLPEGMDDIDAISPEDGDMAALLEEGRNLGYGYGYRCYWYHGRKKCYYNYHKKYYGYGHKKKHYGYGHKKKVRTRSFVATPLKTPSRWAYCGFSPHPTPAPLLYSSVLSQEALPPQEEVLVNRREFTVEEATRRRGFAAPVRCIA